MFFTKYDKDDFCLEMIAAAFKMFRTLLDASQEDLNHCFYFLRRPYGPTDILQEGICVGLVREDQIDDDLLYREIKLRLFQILRRTVPHSV